MSGFDTPESLRKILSILKEDYLDDFSEGKITPAEW
jgi:hypothetical protein